MRTRPTDKRVNSIEIFIVSSNGGSQLFCDPGRYQASTLSEPSVTVTKQSTLSTGRERCFSYFTWNDAHKELFERSSTIGGLPYQAVLVTQVSTSTLREVVWKGKWACWILVSPSHHFLIGNDGRRFLLLQIYDRKCTCFKRVNFLVAFVLPPLRCVGILTSSCWELWKFFLRFPLFKTCPYGNITRNINVF